MMQEFYAWWFANVFDPFGRFVIFDHLILCLVITAVIITILLGCFYKEDPHGWEPWAERWGYPLAILVGGTCFVPLVTVIFVLLLPGAGMVGLTVTPLLCLYRVLLVARQRNMWQKIWRMVNQKNENNVRE